MPRLTQKLALETLRNEIEKLDKRVTLVGLTPTKKKDAFRITLLKDGRSGTAKLKKDLIKEHLSQEGKGTGLKKALGKAVAHLSIRFGR